MNLFPNTICVMQSDHLETYRVFPVPGTVNESITEISVLTPPGDTENPKWKKVMDLLVGVIEQDFGIGEHDSAQLRNGPPAWGGAYGRYEPALEHFPSLDSPCARRNQPVVPLPDSYH